MFRLPLFFVFPVLIQMSSLRHSNRSKRPSSRAAVQAPPPQRRRLTVQQDELAVAVPPPPEPAAAVRLSRPVQLLVSYHFSKPTWPLQLQLPPFRLLRVQLWCLSTPLHQPCRSYHQLLVRQWHQCLQRSLKTSSISCLQLLVLQAHARSIKYRCHPSSCPCCSCCCC